MSVDRQFRWKYWNKYNRNRTKRQFTCKRNWATIEKWVRLNSYISPTKRFQSGIMSARHSFGWELMSRIGDKVNVSWTDETALENFIQTLCLVFGLEIQHFFCVNCDNIYCNLMNQGLPLPSLKEFCLHRFNPAFAPDRWS